MKKGISLLIITLLIVSSLAIVPITAYAADYYSGSWGYSLSGGEATITEYSGNSSSVSVPSSLNGYPVTKIDSYVFEDSNMTELTIPKTMEYIGYRAFNGCKYLTRINFNAKNCDVYDGTVFVNVGKFSNSLSVVFGSTVNHIPDGIFSGSNESEYCHITSVTIPKSVKTIGGSAFSECYDLKTVSWGSSVTKIDSYAFENCYRITNISIPKTMEYIGYRAFNGCKNVKNIKFNAKRCDVYDGTVFVNIGKQSSSLTVTFGSGVKTIPSGLFSGSSESEYCHVTKVTIPNSVTTIEENAFSNCYDLKSVKWGSGIKKIDSYAFEYCSKLTSVTIPVKTEYIGYRAFINCEKLKTIKFNAKNCDVYDGTVFNNCGKSSKKLKVTFGGKVKSITSGLFSGSSNTDYVYVKDVVVSKSVSKVNSYAFSDCYSLKTIKFKGKKTNIEDNAFQGCKKKTKFICYKKSKPAKFAKSHKFKISYIK